MDRWLLLRWNRWAGWGYWTDGLAWFLGVWGLGVLALIALLAWLFPGADMRRRRHTVLLALGAAVHATGLAQLPVLFYYRSRPYLAMPEVFDMLGGEPSPSFPSLHATVAFALAIVLGWESRALGWLTWPVALGIGWARVYAGVHYPSDVVGALAFAFAAACVLVALREELEPALDRVMGVLTWRRDTS